MAPHRPSSGARLAFVFALLAALVPSISFAVAPSVRWHTIETEHFRIHFHEGPNMEPLAQKTARICEAAHALLVPTLKWTPQRRTEVILTDDVDSANGSAFTLYRPWMRLFAEVPDDQSVLNDFDDYLWNLVVHEYTHVLHLDTVGGIPSGIDAVFGKVIIPNAYVPRWLTEGLATYQETRLSNSGRLRSSLFEMWLRASFLDDRGPFDLDEVSHVPLAWPRGNLAYLYGGFFLQYVAEEVGEDQVPAYFREYGDRLIPLTLNDTAREVWKLDFPALYAGWTEKTRARFEAQLAPVRAAGLTPMRVLSRSGYGTDEPHFTRDGERILYLEAGPDRRPAIRSVQRDGSDDRLVRELWASGTFDVSPDGDRLVLSLPEVFEQYSTFDDLYAVDLGTGAMKRLSWGLRATEPSWSPDGRRVAFVGRSGGGHSYLGVMDPSSGTVWRYVESGPDRRVYTPEFSPDGRQIVFSQTDGAGRRLAVLDLETGGTRVVLEGGWLMLQPTWAGADRIVFAGDRTGIYNLYALDLGTGALDQLTNVVTGAFKPSVSPDGRHLAFSTYSAKGYDVAVMATADAFDGELPARPTRPAPVYEDHPEETRPVRPYEPFSSLAPLYWLPVLGEDPLGVAVGATTAGADILERHLYTAEATWGLSSREPGVFLSYTNRTFHPGITVSAETLIAQSAGFPTGFYDRQWAAGAQVRFPFASLDRLLQLSLGYEYRWFDPRFRLTFTPDQRRPTFPRAGSTATASPGLLLLQRARLHPVDQLRGGTRPLCRRSGTRDPGPAGPSPSLRWMGRIRPICARPGSPTTCSRCALSGGVALGDIGDRPVFGLGGLPLTDPLLQLLRGGRSGASALRGLPPGRLRRKHLRARHARIPLPPLRGGPRASLRSPSSSGGSTGRCSRTWGRWATRRSSWAHSSRRWGPSCAPTWSWATSSAPSSGSESPGGSSTKGRQMCISPSEARFESRRCSKRANSAPSLPRLSARHISRPPFAAKGEVSADDGCSSGSHTTASSIRIEAPGINDLSRKYP